MTNDEKCGKITCRIIIEIERNTNSNYSYRKCKTICVDEKMQEVNANLISATNYLIQLFYQTEKKYICTRTKIGKMLSIVAFLYAKNGRKLFDEAIYRYNNCGTTFKELVYIVENEVYFAFGDDTNLDNHIQRINENEINNHVVIPVRFSNTGNLSEEIKSEIKKVFLEFGAFHPMYLGQMINEIIDNINEKSDLIDLESIKNILNIDQKYNGANLIINYLLSNSIC